MPADWPDVDVVMPVRNEVAHLAAAVRSILAFGLALVVGAGAAAAQEAAPAQLGKRVHAAWQGDLDGMLERRLLRVIVPFNRTHYFLDGSRQRGLSYEALQQFEKFLWEKFRLKPPAIDAVYIPTPRDEMLARTNTGVCPWHIVPSDDKKRARLNCISHLLSQFAYETIPFEVPDIPKRKMKHAYDDQATLVGQNFVPEKY